MNIETIKQPSKRKAVENSGEITLEEFASKVKKMRLYQRRYFNTRDWDILAESKKLESEVDAMIGEIFNRQMNLF